MKFCFKPVFCLFMLVKTSNNHYGQSTQKLPMSIALTITIMAYITSNNQHANMMNKNIPLPSRATEHPISKLPIWSIGHRIPILANASWSYGRLIYNYLCNQCVSPLKVVKSNPVHDEVYYIQHYVIKFVSDLRQVGGFLRVLQFIPPIKWYNWNIVEYVVKHHKP